MDQKSASQDSFMNEGFDEFNEEDNVGVKEAPQAEKEEENGKDGK